MTCIHHPELVQAIVSSAIWGAAIGAVAGGRVADLIGRRASLAVADLLFAAGSLCMAAAPSVRILVVGRVLVGLGIGVASVTVPVYIAEISPSHMRAQAVTANVLAITSASHDSLAVFVGYSLLPLQTPANCWILLIPNDAFTVAANNIDIHMLLLWPDESVVPTLESHCSSFQRH